MSRNGIDLLKIQTYVLKVHMHCQGCQQKVKKLLRKIEGVYSVNTDAEHQLVIVSGSVDSASLIKKLLSSGKHAELWSPTQSSYQKLNQGQTNFDKHVLNGLDAFKTPQMFPSLNNDAQDHWSLDNYLYQNIGMNDMSDGINQNQMAAAKVEDTYMRDYEDILAMENHLRSMMTPAAFNGNGADFVGLGDNIGDFQDFSARRPPYGYAHPPSMLMNNMQHRYYFNRPSTDMMHTGNSMMVDPNDMHQTDMMNYRSSLLPLYNDFGFSTAPYRYYY